MALVRVFARAEQGAGFTKAELATASRLSARRVAVLVAQLEDLDIIGRAGRRLSLKRRLHMPELEQFITAIELQRAAELERLQAMIKYGEIASCRMRYLREYFGEPPGDPCDHCDNCRQPLELQPSPLEDHSAERRIAAASPVFEAGQHVAHRKFGRGRVLEVEDTQVVVRFERHGERRILATRLRLQ